MRWYIFGIQERNMDYDSITRIDWVSRESLPVLYYKRINLYTSFISQGWTP